MNVPPTTVPPKKPPTLSPRKRRLRRTITLLVAALFGGGIVGWVVYLKSRPAQYRPDEQSQDITSELVRNLPAESPRPKLTNITREAGLAEFRNFTGDRTSQLPEDTGPGLAWGDFDNDGDDDLLLVSAGGALNIPADRLQPCALYENLGDGKFRNVEAFPQVRIHGMGAAWGDYDGDGLLDLAITGYDSLVLLHNDGGAGKFTREPRLPELKGFWSSPAWGDFDNDRRLDLYVCNYVQYVVNETERSKVSQQIGTAVPYTLNPSSYPGGRNALFHQRTDGSFANVAAEMMVENSDGRSLGGVWHDFDQDGWLDLYIANDVSDNVLYRNAAERFHDISHPAWVADYRSAMGLAIGDFDRDGDDDMHITHWVAQENALYENLLVNSNAMRIATNSPAATNQVTAKKSRFVFVDIADQKGLGQIALPFVGWGTEFVDLDQDGWLDLLAVNGSTLEADGPPPRQLQGQETFVFWNQRGQFFHNLAPLNASLSEKHSSRGLACADFDADGDMDFAIADLYEGVRLFRNDMTTGHWLKVRLKSKNATGQANGFGDGSTAIAWVGDVPLRRSVTGVSYLSQSSHTLHWGLGPVTRVERLEVRWHAGRTNLYEGLDANTTYECVEGETALRRVQAGPAADPRNSDSQTRSGASPANPTPADEKQRLLQFWNLQRAAMNAMKVEKDNPKAIRLFREAIVLNPKHEDSRYYLGLCLAGQGDIDSALASLAELQKLNPQSHRAWQQWGVVRATFPGSTADLAAAEAALQRAHSLNPEETGALLVLAEVALLRGDTRLADERLAAATHTNPKAIGGFFLRGYVAWKRGERATAKQFLEQTRTARGPDWQPKGATSEGDVKQKQHLESSPLASFWLQWDGQPDPAPSFAALDRRLTAP